MMEHTLKLQEMLIELCSQPSSHISPQQTTFL